MVKTRSAKSKQRYFSKNYAPAQVAALRSKKTSTRLCAQISQKASKPAQSKVSASVKTAKTANSRTNKRKVNSGKANSATNKTKKRTGSNFSRNPMTWREVTLLSSIGVCAIVIAFTLIYSNIFDPVKRSEHELEKIANAYYTEYYYPRLLGKYLNQPEKILADYSAAGLPAVLLRQLLLSNDGKYSDSAEAFSNRYYQCDTNNSFVRYYPVEPYGPRDYTVSYYSDCKKTGV